MEEKKATGSYNRKSIIRSTFSQWRRKRGLGVLIGKRNPKTNFFTMEEKKATASYNRKRLSNDQLFYNGEEKDTLSYNTKR